MHDIPILMLHSVNDKHNLNPMGSLSVHPRELEGYLAAFKILRYQMISMKDLLEGNYIQNNRYIVLTFDDGFKDNIFYAKNLLKKYNAKATIFINPEYCSYENTVSTWGFMTNDELCNAERSGVFDLQAHGMTHEFIFKSTLIIDFYTKNKFDKYYWLAWMLFPDSPRNWNDEAYKYADMIPEGYPIFEYDRRLSCEKFMPDTLFVEKSIRMFKEYSNKESLAKILNSDTCYKGCMETYEQYISEIKYQLGECKVTMESQLKKEISIICFPGGGYNEVVLDIAKEFGYRCYMNSSKLRDGNNFDHIESYKNGNFVGFNRTSFTHIQNKLLSSWLASMLIAIVSLGDYQNIGLLKFVKHIFRKMKKTMG